MIDTTGMSLQQVSDAIAGKLIKQGGRCIIREMVNEIGHASCAYSDGAGNHCAIGWLLSESSPLMQYSCSLAHLIGVSGFDIEPNGEFIESNMRALGAIQILHDSNENRSQMSKSITEAYDLNMDAWSEWLEMGVS